MNKYSSTAYRVQTTYVPQFLPSWCSPQSVIDWKMAGILGATTSPTSIIAGVCLFKPNPSSSSSTLKFTHTKLLIRSHSFLSFLRMADFQNNSSETKEPSPKIPKLQHNGVVEVPQNLTPLLRVKKLSPKAVLPSRASPLSAGYDLSSAVETKVPARGKALVPTDLSISIPEGTYARVAPRSGLAWKNSIDVGAGVIDADYRGPVGVILFNHSDLDFEVKVGDRIAQLLIEKILTPDVLEVEDLDSTVRGEGGFGSTGV
ncbi:deoxyuridine 5'-triphosphate nucleotidohydrolase-like [Quillaja saponaria]|uniref:Deoxyuridine 5'-triphosphate nucleotidohydrolase n=1 Tax=Quillaja saponaria TaxID=32244 RepID=A0AAD7LYU2_QUISA|nr:deoxyuridine 5'-triphosphate nucleotidohydrolase-like [Quillaja saponaria]